ncbi:hypothetical protein [Criblamydia sequanensis]|uniref:Methyltransferase n=1 Tax=Candidatus Criblamydia sequanensis CRIB-18 TaxID=1437425 RepID=A0A090CY92_9BACT|nr:hypothetical protein [Criblamydia sequanensis]CDR33417.1 hypothetical protein CSEC_0584 [Criblamydia sequanensis CRIB-18]
MSLSQFEWRVPNVVGHSIDPFSKKIKVDHTEGFGAFDSIFTGYASGVRVVDIGGGEHDYNKAYCLHKYFTSLSILDPFMRTAEHNNLVLQEAKLKPFDSCTSISVLNVINLIKSRMEHIKLCKSVVKECGKVFFKVWPGDGSGIEKVNANCFQSNRTLETYLDEIKKVFGSKNVKFDSERKIIIAVKNSP